jgi:hypothetical protein
MEEGPSCCQPHPALRGTDGEFGHPLQAGEQGGAAAAARLQRNNDLADDVNDRKSTGELIYFLNEGCTQKEFQKIRIVSQHMNYRL